MASTTFDIGARLDNEAGISAYTQTDPINLDNVATAFRVIEARTTDYIIGSVAATGYTEHYDAHVYVHKDGWILAYYLKQDPVSKIVNVQNQTISSTILYDVVSNVAGTSGLSIGSVKYYDFRYPNATNILFVLENKDNGNDFTIVLPGSYGYYERGWSLYSNYGNQDFILDGVNLRNSATYWSSYSGYGVISASSLLPDVTHQIEVWSLGVLVIVYKEQ
jgi:hypothetical protein